MGRPALPEVMKIRRMLLELPDEDLFELEKTIELILEIREFAAKKLEAENGKRD